jgi:transposase
MGTISMSVKERRRLAALSRVAAGEISLRSAGEAIGVSYRQMKRSYASWKLEGDAALVHKSRGRVSNRAAKGDALRERALAAYAERYSDYGPTLASEVLAKEGIVAPRETLRRWLSAAGLRPSKPAKRKHRSRRPRRERFGELVQMDGSKHDWFGGRRKEATLMVAIDDATGRIWARFFEEETFEAACETFRGWCDRHGLPLALYVDRAGIYRSDREPTAGETMRGERPETQFGRAMRELDVELILARSAQAKGRVERENRTLQDRLVKALKRAGAATLEEGNRLLESSFLGELNEKFAKPPAAPGNAHRPAIEIAWDRILCVRAERVVRNDWTISWYGRPLQIPKSEVDRVRPKMRLTVCETPDGRLRLYRENREIPWTEPGPVVATSERSAKRSRRDASRPIGSSQGSKPVADHPWRKGFGPSGLSRPRLPPAPSSPASTAPAADRSAPAR